MYTTTPTIDRIKYPPRDKKKNQPVKLNKLSAEYIKRLKKARATSPNNDKYTTIKDSEKKGLSIRRALNQINNKI